MKQRKEQTGLRSDKREIQEKQQKYEAEKGRRKIDTDADRERLMQHFRALRLLL
jgi:hypothetical protein